MASPCRRNDEQRLVATGEDYECVVSKASSQGMRFQLCLLAQFAIRALQLGFEDFRLGTEVGTAGKFDDIVFFYKDSKGKRRFQLLQAKYGVADEPTEDVNNTSKAPSNTVGEAQLLQDEGPFSLPTYFKSHRDLKRSHDLMTPHDQLESMIICSNKKLVHCEAPKHFSSANLLECGVHTLLNNQLLKFKCDFNVVDSQIHHIAATLKSGVVKIPKDFAKSIIGGKIRYKPPKYRDNECKRGLYDSYVKCLHHEVVDNSTKTFREDFVTGRNLSSASGHYRSELWFSHKEGDKEGENDFLGFLRNKSIEVIGKATVEPLTDEFKEELFATQIVDLIAENGEDSVIFVDPSRKVICESIDQSMGFVFVEFEGIFHFRSQFLSGGWLPSIFLALKICLQDRLSDKGLEFHELKKYSFKLEGHTPSIICNRYFGERLELDVREFLNLLSLSMEQPSIELMESYIKIEMRKLNKTLTRSSADDRYAILMYWITKWAEEKLGHYLMREDINKLVFSDCFTFNLQSPVSDFSGREASLKEIHRKLNGHDSRNSIPRALVIYGLGGVGKTELVRKYSQIHFMSHYSHLVWLESENIERLQNSFAKLAFQRLGLDEKTSEGKSKDMSVVVQETYHFFNAKRSLFVFDNADSNQWIGECIRWRVNYDNIHVIITSRSGVWKTFQIERLENFTERESFVFIESSIGKLPIFDEKEARELAYKLSHYPLAIKQAVSFIKQRSNQLNTIGKSFRISSYLKLLEEKGEEVLDKNFEEEILNGYPLTALKTMQIAVKHVLNSENSKVPMKILNIMSFLSPDNIETNVLSLGLNSFSDDEISRGFELLSSLSIISIKDLKAGIHRLIQLVNRIRLKKDEYLETIRLCFSVAQVMDIEHLISVWEHSTKYGTLVQEFRHIPRRISCILFSKYQLDVYLEFLNKATDQLRRNLGVESIEVLECMERVSVYHFLRGNYEDCAKIRSECLKLREKSTGGKNADYVFLLYQYALVLDRMDKEDKVGEIVNDILKILDSIPEEDSENLMQVKSWLVKKLMDDRSRDEISRKYRDDVRSHCESLIKRFKETVGQESDPRKMKRAVLSNEKKGGEEKLEELKKQMIGIFEGVDVNCVINAYFYLAHLKFDEEEYDEHSHLLGEARQLTLKHFGQKNHMYDAICYKLASSLYRQGKHEECLAFVSEEMTRLANDGDFDILKGYEELDRMSSVALELGTKLNELIKEMRAIEAPRKTNAGGRRTRCISL